ncbi:hypothetical protein [Glycomyces paridis]|uniref:DUF4190 domain-containing protein n=1 Tax=Glycomyces paridis TaxID=2126555 RepID=A0A4S8PP19_9ACTN|nr:hypothetical protein [Glycomyces paridis]THV31412.1 hypothetical protein E9998_03350 [Glycomyces paridis]
MSQPPEATPPSPPPPPEPPEGAAFGASQPEAPQFEAPQPEYPAAPPQFPPPPGPPPPYPWQPRQPAQPSKTISILALVFGGAAVLFALIPVAGIFLGGMFGVAAIVLGILGIFKSHRLFAIIGIALAVVGLIIAVVVTVATGRAVEEFVEDFPTTYGDEDTGDDDATEDDGERKQDQVVDGTDPAAPLPAGTVVDTGNWQVAVSDVTPDDTEELLKDEFNLPPEEGFQFYRFHVEATYVGPSSGIAWLDLYFGAYIDSTVYTEPCGYLAEDLAAAPEVYPDGTASGDVCVVVPTEGADAALITIEDASATFERFFLATG